MNSVPSPQTDCELQLAELRSRLLSMAGLVDHQLDHPGPREAVRKHDPRRAQEAIEMDAQANYLEEEVDALCYRLLKHWSPPGEQLRLVVLALKVVTDLERIGDLAVGISARALQLAQCRATWHLNDVQVMAQTVRTMVSSAVNAFVTHDAETARTVVAQDTRVDSAGVKASDSFLKARATDPRPIQAGLDAQSLAQWLERIGNHATNLAEQVIYMVEDVDVRHSTPIRESEALRSSRFHPNQRRDGTHSRC